MTNFSEDNNYLSPVNQKANTYPISSAIRQSFFFQNTPTNLDPSYKMDLDLWECVGRV